MVDLGVEKSTISHGDTVIEGQELKELCIAMLQYKEMLKLADKRYDARVLDALLMTTDFSVEASRGDGSDESLEKVEAYLKVNHEEALPVTLDVEDDQEHHSHYWKFTTRHKGSLRESQFDTYYLERDEFLLRALADKFQSPGEKTI